MAIVPYGTIFNFCFLCMAIVPYGTSTTLFNFWMLTFNGNGTTATTIAIAWMPWLPWLPWLLDNGNGNGNGDGATGGGTLDQAQTSSAAYIRSYAKTFSKFIAIYNHLSHFHISTFPQASTCLWSLSYLCKQLVLSKYSISPGISNVLWFQVIAITFKLFIHRWGEYQTCNYSFYILYVYKNFFPGIVKLVHMA